MLQKSMQNRSSLFCALILSQSTQLRECSRIEQPAAALDVIRADARAKGVTDVQDVAEALEACQRELSKGTEIMSEKLLESAESHLEKARQSISGALLEIERKREVLRLAMQKLAGAETRMRNAMVDATESGIDTLEVIRAAIREANKAVEGGKIKMPTSPEMLLATCV